ncbi:hypothetical protein GCM10023116_36100 [Kistimonas scapharcae]|uniref:30S ribosomal protein S7 n=1 Tax=Kistimonas scapharcae TaxID=1036133 RepID=A0ABP8V604_9GAMM
MYHVLVSVFSFHQTASARQARLKLSVMATKLAALAEKNDGIKGITETDRHVTRADAKAAKFGRAHRY